jgi:hypothetical protein
MTHLPHRDQRLPMKCFTTRHIDALFSMSSHLAQTHGIFIVSVSSYLLQIHAILKPFMVMELNVQIMHS